jgi:hypothetical protein
MWVAAVGGAALGCYMVSLQVATERAELARVESQIIAAKRDIRTLQTELGTRGRLSQLENWNADVLALSAPASAQFLKNEFNLARFEQNGPSIEQRSAEVRLASAETQAPAPAAEAKPVAPVVRALAPAPAPAQPVLQRASLTTSSPAKAPEPDLKAPKPKAKAEPIRVASIAAATPAAKPDKPGAAKARPAPSRRGLDSTLASEIGAAARAEDKKAAPGRDRN